MTRYPATSQSAAVSAAEASPGRGTRTADHYGPDRELREVPATGQAIRADALNRTVARPAGGDFRG